MAKAKRKAKVKRANAAVSTPPPPPAALFDTSGRTDIDARQLESVDGANRKEVDWKSDSEPKLETTLQVATENAELVGEAWQERIRREGIPYFACPICPGPEHKFTGKTAKKDCQAHINKEHKMRVKELKMTKAPKALYEPKPRTESPKRTMADAVHPKYRAQVEAAQRASEMLRPISEHARRLSTGSANAMVKLVTMTESLAIQQLPRLNDQELVEVYQLATNRGKRLLCRAARKLCEQKHINIGGPREQTPRQKSIQDALLNASFAAAAAR